VVSSAHFDAGIVDLLPNEPAQALAVVLDTGDVQLVTSDDYLPLANISPNDMTQPPLHSVMMGR
jgi:hypothetical protein